MTLQTDYFALHDVSAFPLVRFHGELADAGYALQWQSEMEALLANGAPFVILYTTPRGEESQGDRKLRGIWLKENRAVLARLCCGLASVEPDADRRKALQQMADGATRAFGVKQIVAETETAALEQLVQVLKAFAENPDS